MNILIGIISAILCNIPMAILKNLLKSKKKGI